MPPAIDGVLRSHGVDPKQFAVWFGPKLGHYRGMAAAAAARATASEDLAMLRGLASVGEAGSTLLSTTGPAGRADEELFLEAHAAGVDWHALRARLVQDLMTLRVVASRAAAKRESAPAQKPGAKLLARRDELLLSVYQRLRGPATGAKPMKAAVAYALIEQIMILCQVEVGRENAIEKAIKKARTKGKNRRD